MISDKVLIMRDEIIKLKGSRQGLTLVFQKGTAFSKVFDEIKGKLETGSNFFRRGTLIYIQPGMLPEGDMASLKKLFNQHGILFRVAVPPPPIAPKKPEPSRPIRLRPEFPSAKENDPDPAAKEQKMLVVNRTVRGGQRITSEGGILICGNVNPGAEIIAGGSIDIRGKCRGTVHAGASGDESAVIIADRLMPVQLRIAQQVADTSEKTKKPVSAERALIRNGRIVIESIERYERYE